MKIKTGVSLHNRFDVVKNGEWVGYAENIILDQMYSRLCSLSTYFVNIHFGVGSGTPTPERTSLFSHLGTKSAVTEETIKALPTSKVTKKITLNPEEHVDKIITEVGIAYGTASTNLVTHAMIKDVEGNPLSISKSSLDVIIIYSSVFITLNDANTKMTLGDRLPVNPTSFSDAPLDKNYNNLLDYLIKHVALPTSIPVHLSSYDSLQNAYPIGLGRYSKYATRSSNTAEKTVTYTTRFGISEGNGVKIAEVAFGNISKLSVETYMGATTFVLTDKQIGTGDGVATEFDLQLHDISNLQVKVGGVVTTDYTVENSNLPDFISLDSLIDYTYEGVGGVFDIPLNGFYYKTIYARHVIAEFKTVVPLTDYSIAARVVDNPPTRFFYLEKSNDGVTWTETTHLISPNEKETIIPFNVTTELYYRFSINVSDSYAYGIRIKPNNKPKIVFNNPPTVDSGITISGSVPYYPKDENYVFDAALEIQFGEGF